MAGNTQKKLWAQYTKIEFDGESDCILGLEDVEEIRQLTKNKKKKKNWKNDAKKEKDNW